MKTTGWAILALISLSNICTANIVANGGFESGDFTSWVLVADPIYTFVDNSQPHSGIYGANLGEFDSVGTLTQTLLTVPDQEYTLRYWLQNVGGAPNSFSVWWNNSLVSSSVVTDADDGFVYTLFAARVVAQSSTTDLEFRFQHVPSFWSLDDIAASPVPEPATASLCAAGMAAVLFRKRLGGGPGLILKAAKLLGSRAQCRR